ncbi:ankyrin [Colletotrichum falcatum]|nr:ankyrin [Colletotrichum falcatum]
MAAAIAMLDGKHAQLPQDDEDTNCYIPGRIKRHNVVIACLPEGEYGTNNAANVMTNLNRTFPRIRVCLMVGIGGGAPCLADIRLGDVVVGTRVMQYDLGKVIRNGDLQRTAIFKTAPPSLRTAVTALRAAHDGNKSGKSNIPAILKEKFGEKSDYGRPDSPDHLFSSAYDHIAPAPDCRECESCDQSRLVPRSVRRTYDPQIHYGAIASGNQVMRSAYQRDIIARELDVMCFEMEAAGLMGNFPCLPIRGICDYADSHKSKAWQKYAAATAAAYATELLAVLPGAPSHPKHRHTPHDDHRSSDDHRQTWLDSLKFKQLDSRQSTIIAAHNKTCRWFLESPNYNEWLKPEMLAEHRGLLWIRGKPGAGKSTLMKYLYATTPGTHGRQTVVACFFFNARGENLERSLEGMYRSLLLQLFGGYPELKPVLDDVVITDKGRFHSLNTLKDVFRKAVLELDRRRLTCFIDALDECDEQQVMDMVDYFEDLTSETTDAGVELRICFSSRHYPYVDTERGIKITLEDQKGHTEDLVNYVVSRLRIQNRELKEELQSKLIEKASGVFLWVVLVVNVLNKEYARGGMALRKRLAEMPSGLHDLFKDMLRRDNTDRDQLLLCVLWILCARRPLHPGEFLHAMWSDPSLKDLIDEELPVVGTSDAGNSMEVCVIGISKGLAEITKSERPTVQFIHESVRDFLLKSGGLQELWPGLGFDWKIPSHERLKTCCQAYLSHPLVHEPAKRLMSLSKADVSAELPFLEYASQQVLYHADIAAEGIGQHGFLSDLDLPGWIRVTNHFKTYEPERYNPDADLLYILADGGHSKLIRNWLQHHSPDIVLPKERYKHPLFAALVHCHRDSVAALLKVDSPIQDEEDFASDLDLRNFFERFAKRTPLTWAAQKGRFGMVKILLQNGANVSQEDEDGITALKMASEYGRENIVNLLIQKGADVNPSSGSFAGQTPLSHSVIHNLEPIARVLIQGGANMDDCLLVDPKTGKTALSESLSRHSPATTAVLLVEKGLDIQQSPETRRDLLFEAISLNKRAASRRLIESGQDVNVRDVRASALLFSAIRLRNEKGLKRLLEAGVDLELQSPQRESPLFEAVGWGYRSIVRLLVEGGADVNFRNDAGETPLSRALDMGHEVIAKYLYQEGARHPGGESMSG